MGVEKGCGEYYRRGRGGGDGWVLVEVVKGIYSMILVDIVDIAWIKVKDKGEM